MSANPTLFEKLKGLVAGPSKSTHTAPPAQDGFYHLNRKLDAILAQLNTLAAGSKPEEQPPEAGSTPAAFDDLADQVRKLAKAQFKANTLQESQVAQQAETVTSLQKSLEQQAQQLFELRQVQQQAIQQAQVQLLESLLPVLDGLDAAFAGGRRQVLALPMPLETRQAVIAWLDGVRLARDRMLDVLKSHNISPIATVGQPFDPNRHVAVATDTTGRLPDGLIVSEDRRGYATPAKVLRFAEVVVAKRR